jgi:hypothetical protein
LHIPIHHPTAKEAFDPGVKQYFVKLARDYRHLAELQGAPTPDRTRAEAEGGERGIWKRPAAASVRGTVKRKRVEGKPRNDQNREEIEIKCHDDDLRRAEQ